MILAGNQEGEVRVGQVRMVFWNGRLCVPCSVATAHAHRERVCVCACVCGGGRVCPVK